MVIDPFPDLSDADRTSVAILLHLLHDDYQAVATLLAASSYEEMVAMIVWLARAVLNSLEPLDPDRVDALLRQVIAEGA